MFGFTSSSTLFAGQHDAEAERSPPARPTPLSFPSLVPPEPSRGKIPPTWHDGEPSGIFSRFIKIKKPTDVNIDHLSALNVSFAPECDFETLLSSVSQDGLSYLPPKSWLESADGIESVDPASSEPPRLLSNGRKPPDRRDFYTRAKELYFKNEDAFSVLTRRSKEDLPPPRLAHFRRFWEGLDNLAYYWDDSLDEYIPPKDEKDAQTTATNEACEKAEAEAMNVAEPRKKAKTSSESPEPSLSTTDSSAPGESHSIQSSFSLPARSQPPKVPWTSPPNGQQQEEKIPGTYRGNRIGNGADMPDQYRIDCVRSFLEPIAWSFGITMVPHRRPPTLAIGTMRFPVRMNTVAWRAPKDRMRARSGGLEGPLMGVQCRPETAFGSSESPDSDSVLDVVRELGGLLLLAQERAREGQTEKRAGEGKWWTTKPRWGGGPGGEVGEATGASDAPAPKEKKDDDKPMPRSRTGTKERRKMSAADAWKILRPSNPQWDPKILYEAIGKDKSLAWDEIFMVSSLNHHISILKLRIHRLYLQHLLDGSLPTEPPADPLWSSPVLQRTKWFDLFNVDERVEAMRGAWGIMHYLMRTQEEEDIPMSDS